jgi:hypothetical protein
MRSCACLWRAEISIARFVREIQPSHFFVHVSWNAVNSLRPTFRRISKRATGRFSLPAKKLFEERGETRERLVPALETHDALVGLKSDLRTR